MTVRRATPDDAAELTRLRGVMYETWGIDTSGDWRSSCEDFFRARLAGDDFAAYVVESGDGRLVATGVGWVLQHLPSPFGDGRRGHIASMSTDPTARRQGHARRIVAALLGWFGELGVNVVELRATPMGEPLYRLLGFTEPRGVDLVWRAPGTSAPTWQTVSNE